MPKRRPRLWEEGRQREDWEYLDWADRILQEAEDLRWTADEEAWKEHMRDTMYTLSADPASANRQLHGLWNRGVAEKYLGLIEEGVTPSRFMRAGKMVQEFRNPRGQFMSPTEVLQVLRGMR